jgi:succinate-semialdehyde dehydrogenase/glutarate-semialdehyde dehydrogenase
MLQSIDPTTNKLIKEYVEHSQAEIDTYIKSAEIAYKLWRKTEHDLRSDLFKNLFEQLEKHKEYLAILMAQEMGKPLQQGRSEIEKCKWLCTFYAENGPLFLQDEMVETDASKSFVSFRPLGVILAIMPWNFPFWQVFRCSIPALMAGNAVVLKHSENTSGCALEIEKLIYESGFPEDIFRTILVDKSNMQLVIQHKNIVAVTFTGSTRAGRIVAAQAGEKLKKTVLELGGSDPYLIFSDADLKHAAELCASSRLLNCGQTCISAKRFIVVEDVYDEFLDLFKFQLQNNILGDPLKDGLSIGPMARHDLRDELHRQVKQSIEQGAIPEMGCEIPDDEGAFYPISLLTNIKSGMPAYQEELFGPVASVIKVKNAQQAVYVANDTNYGLGAAIFSKDINRAEKIAAEELEAGCCFVNTMVKSDPRLPFGGIKNSGYGRELGLQGIREFVNTKTTLIG